MPPAILAAVPQRRRLPNWITSFLEYSDGTSGPELFRRWSAIACIAGALERKTWVRTLGSNLYPNLYVVLVAPPGVGKTVSLTPTENLWRTLPDHHTAPTSLTKAALVDALHDASRKIIRPGEDPPYVEFHSLLVLAGELGVLLPMYDSDFMNALTAIYDGHPYAERRRSKDLKISIPAPQLNLLGATTPSYLNAFMPEGAWDQGFISRTILIYCGEKVIRPLFTEINREEALFDSLSDDLRWIGSLYGKFTFDEDAARAISAWHQSGGEPTPEHPKLAHYITRRTAHLLKLCMVASASHSDSLIITLDDYQTALDWMIEAELHMPDIFRSMNSGGDSAAIEECWYYLWQTHAKEKKPIAEHRVFHFLGERVPSHSVEKIIQVMVKSALIKQEVFSGGVGYTPAVRSPNR